MNRNQMKVGDELTLAKGPEFQGTQPVEKVEVVELTSYDANTFEPKARGRGLHVRFENGIEGIVKINSILGTWGEVGAGILKANEALIQARQDARVRRDNALEQFHASFTNGMTVEYRGGDLFKVSVHLEQLEALLELGPENFEALDSVDASEAKAA